MRAWLRRLFRRPPTIADIAVSHAKAVAAIEALPAALEHANTLIASTAPDARVKAAIAAAPCEPLKAAEADPYAGVVTGPQLVDRTKHTHALHQARWADDDGWDIEFGPFRNPYDDSDAA